MTWRTVRNKYTCVFHRKGNRYYFVRTIIGLQEFTVYAAKDRKAASWMREQLAKALHKMIEENQHG